MKELTVFENGMETEGTINTIKLVEIINEFRKTEGKAELRHNDFMKKIKKELETLESLGLIDEGNFSLVKYMDKKGEQRPCYNLTRDGMLQMLNSESTLVRYRTVEYINKLEQDNKQLTTDNKELHTIAISDADLEKRQYEADRVHYAINNIEKRLLECNYTNIVATADKIIDVHTNLFVKDRYKAHKDVKKYGNKGDSLYVNHVKTLVVAKLDKIKPIMTMQDSNINSILASKARKLEKEVSGSRNITTGREKGSLQNKIDELDPSLEEMYCVHTHPFTYNCALDGCHRSYSYNNWINNFPVGDVPDMEMWELDYGIDFNKPIKIFLRYINMQKFDMDNLSKSFIDRLFNEKRGIYEIDDKIIHAKDEKTIEHCNGYQDGKVYFYLQNMSDEEIKNIDYEEI